MTRIPTKEDILAWVSDNPSKASKRDIARAFGVRGPARLDLKRLLKELEAEGLLAKRRKTYRDPGRLPPVSVLQVDKVDTDGDLVAHPLEWQGQGQAPTILVMQGSGDPALAPGDRIPRAPRRGQERVALLQGAPHPSHRHQPGQNSRDIPQVGFRQAHRADRQGRVERMARAVRRGWRSEGWRTG